MNKKVFTALVLLMGISIFGIIIVQLVWLNNALKVKNELFERGVAEALNSTVEELDLIHNMGVVNELMFDDSVAWSGNQHIGQGYSFISKRNETKNKKPVTIIREPKKGKGNSSFTIKIKIDSTDNSDLHYEYETELTEVKSDSNVFVIRTNKKPQNKLFFVSDTIHGDLDSLFTKSIIVIDSLETRLEPISDVAPGFSKQVINKTTHLKRIANQVVTEVISWDAFKVNHEEINDALKKALKEQNISIDYEYGVLRDSVVTGGSENVDTLRLLNSPFQASLYPSNIFAKNLSLSVYFPGKESFIYRSINWLLAASFLFSMIILVTFALSIFYILRQKKISEMKSDFINNMTHEFKTPIATIGVATDSIANQKVIADPDRIRYFLGMIKKENSRMNRQVEDILTIARLDKREFEFKWQPIDVHELIRDAIEGISIQAEKRSGKIETSLNASNPVVTTDKFHCTNVVYNLLDNAMKYSDEAPQVKVVTQNSAKGIEIRVIDNGIGMAKAVQSRVFEKFYRQAGGNIHNVKGFGLGLSYVKAVVDANLGKITVQSEPGKGSEFSVFLPYTRED